MTASDWIGLVGLLVAVFGGFLSFVTMLIAFFIKRNEDAQDLKIEEAKESIAELLSFASWARVELGKYEVNVGAGKIDIAGIHTDLRDHVRREEQDMWPEIVERLASLEASMPNGEIAELTKAVSRIEAQLLLALADTARAAKHIDESGEWRQRVIKLEEAMRRRGR